MRVGDIRSGTQEFFRGEGRVLEKAGQFDYDCETNGRICYHNHKHLIEPPNQTGVNVLNDPPPPI